MGAGCSNATASSASAPQQAPRESSASHAVEGLDEGAQAAPTTTPDAPPAEATTEQDANANPNANINADADADADADTDTDTGADTDANTNASAGAQNLHGAPSADAGDAAEQACKKERKRGKKDRKKAEEGGGPQDVVQAARLKVMKKCFAALDLDGSGTVEVEEWKKYLIGAGVDQAVVDKHANAVMKDMDEDSDGKITFAEFSGRCVRLSKKMSDADFSQFMADLVNTCRTASAESGASGTFNSYGQPLAVEHVLETLIEETRVKKLSLCFAALDKDKSGNVDLDELKSFLAKVKCVQDGDKVMAEAESLMVKMDVDFDRQISKREFMSAMSRFKNTVTEEEFAKLVDGIFNACSGKEISDNVLRDAVDRDSTYRKKG